MELKGSKTEQNLMTAFAGESQARNKYTYFASKAKKEGYEQIAAIFQETADNENHALSAKGYVPITQIVGYLISGDPTYITGYQNARSLICRIDRDELLEELVQFYLSKNV